MSPRSVAALLALAALLVVAGVAAGLGGAGPATDGPAAGAEAPVSDRAPAQDEAVGADRATHTPTNVTRAPASVTFRVQLERDGDARWHVSTSYRIRDANDSAAFDELAEQFNDSDAPLGYDSFRLARDRASAATDREMIFRNVQRNTTRNATRGTLRLSFTWSNFARSQGDELYVGDAFNTTNGTWFPELSGRQTLVIEPPSGYGLDSAPQGVEFVDGAARWEGPYEFDGPEPWIVYSGDAPTATDTTVTTGPPTTSAAPPTNGTVTPGGGLGSMLPVVLLVVLAGAGAAALAVYARRDDSPGDGGSPAVGAAGGDAGGTGGGATTETTAESGDDGSKAGAVETTSPATAGPESAGESESAAAAAGASAAAADAADDDGDEVEEALLSDEERVERLLERNGGRMKQANIVKETGWSNAKVSQLLSSMADEDRIDKLRIGRENLISFPDEDVTDIPSNDEE